MITEEILRDLYLTQLKTEHEIAVQFGTSQVQVGRLRKKWGIPTLGKTGRIKARLPDMTDTQQGVLLGSLLGDGHLSLSSKHAARFDERHSSAQESYLRWKAEVFGSYLSAFYPWTKTDGDSVYTGMGFYTVSCPQLRPWYDLFYPEGKRVFPNTLSELISPLALAVWFMDDGSRGPRIAFGMDDTSLRRAIKALKALGLKATVYGEGSNKSLGFPGQTQVFQGLVEPYIPECMRYKLVPDTQRRRTRLVSAMKVRELYVNGVSLGGIATTLGVSRNTVRRRLSGVPMRPVGRSKAGLTKTAANVALSHYDPQVWATLNSSDQETWVTEIRDVLREMGFPYPSPVEEMHSALDAVRKSDMALDTESRIRPWSVAGIRACASLFPNRFHAVSKGKVSAYTAWHTDSDLIRAIQFQLNHGDPVLPERVLRAVTLNARTPTVFRPTVAKYLYETYCPPGGRVYDPCAGYGGRALGAIAAGVLYLGTDVDPETVSGNQRMIVLCGAEDRAQVIEARAETFDPGRVDFVFTSSPYFDQERYSMGKDQSWVRHGGKLDAWLEGFLRPVIRTARASLGPRKFMALNIADVRGKPLVASTIEVASSEGFLLIETLKMPLARINRAESSEPVLIFRAV